MRVVRSEVHRRHHCLELSGTTLVPSWESPERAAHVDAALDRGVHDIVEPSSFDRALVDSVHDPAYVDFLASAWDRWRSEGNSAPAAMAFGWPARRLNTGRSREPSGSAAK